MEKATHQGRLIVKNMKATLTRSGGTTDAKEIARCVRSAVDTFKRRGWSVSLARSSKSLSRYIYATKGKRKVKVRVSDHRPNNRTVCDISYLAREYKQRHLASYLDGRRKRKPRTRLRKKHPR